MFWLNQGMKTIALETFLIASVQKQKMIYSYSRSWIIWFKNKLNIYFWNKALLSLHSLSHLIVTIFNLMIFLVPLSLFIYTKFFLVYDPFTWIWQNNDLVYVARNIFSLSVTSHKNWKHEHEQECTAKLDSKISLIACKCVWIETVFFVVHSNLHVFETSALPFAVLINDNLIIIFIHLWILYIKLHFKK